MKHSKLPLVALFFLTLFVGACSTKEKGNIYGLVTESGSAEPVRAAGVSLSYRGSLLLRTVTYDDGHFEFNDLAPGMYEILVELDGYKNFSTSVIVESGRTARTDMQLKKIDTGMTVLTYEPSVQGNTVSFSGKYSYSRYRPDEYGFVYGTASSPTVKNDNVVKVSSSSFTFSVEIKTIPKGVYYVRAYAKNSTGTEYGENKRFEISGLPGVTTIGATNTTTSTATLNGRIEYAGNPAYTEKGFVYSRYFINPTIDDPATSTTRIKVTGSSNDFSANIAGLTKDATYYVRAYAINNIGIVYGESILFVAAPYYKIESIYVQLEDLGKMPWEDGKSACSSSRVGGLSSWRLPTKAELAQIYTNRIKIGGFGIGYYWTSEQPSSPSCAYSIDFSTGTTYGNTYKSNDFSVRCVRSL